MKPQRFVCSHQPSFLPWIGFWNKLAMCDTYIALTGRDYALLEYGNRVKLSGSWLTLPLVKDTKHGAFKDVKVLDTKAAAKSIEKTICGKRYPYSERLRPVIDYLANTPTTSLAEVNLWTGAMIVHLLGMTPRILIDESPTSHTLSKTESLIAEVYRVVPLNCGQGQHEAGRGCADCRDSVEITYYAGQGALAYLDRTRLAGMKVMVQELIPGPNVQDETILQLIARVKDPIRAVTEAARWRPL